MSEVDGPYMGFLSNNELLELLNKWLQQEIQAATFFTSTITKEQQERSQKRRLTFNQGSQFLISTDSSLKTAQNPTDKPNTVSVHSFKDFEAELHQQIKSSLSKISQEPIRKLLENLLA